MNDKINLQYFVNLIAERHNLSEPDAQKFVSEFFSLIEESLQNDRQVKVEGLGTFRLVDVNNDDGVEQNSHIAFSPDSSISEIINRPFEHFDTVVLNDGVTFSDLPEVKEGDDDYTDTTDDTVVQSDYDNVEAEAPVEEAPVEEAPVEDIPVEAEAPIEETTAEEVPAEEVPTEEAPAEESPAEEEKAEEPEEDPLAKMIAEAVRQKEKRGAIVSDMYSKNESADGQQKKKSRSSGRGMRIFINCFLIFVLLSILACGYMVTKMYFPEIFDDDSNEMAYMDTAHAFQHIVLSDTVMPTALDSVDKAEVMALDSAMIADSIAKAKAAAEILESNKDVKPVAVKEVKAIEAPKPAEKVAEAMPAKYDEQNVVKTVDRSNDPAALSAPVHPDTNNYRIVGTKATHTVKSGETMTRVSLKYYGTKDLYPYIVKHNNLADPNNVPVGTALKIPELVKK